jgi:hypothetical protein
MMWEWRRPDEMALSRKPLSNGSKTGLLERQFDRVINHALPVGSPASMFRMKTS